jgi:hypothetical protein
MAQHITASDYSSTDDADWIEPIARTIVMCSASTQRRAQGELFGISLLPRQWPTFKHGPEDEVVFH